MEIATIYFAEGGFKKTEIDEETGDGGLAMLQKAVGGYVERVMLPSGQHGYVNKDGRLYLPRNRHFVQFFGNVVVIG